MIKRRDRLPQFRVRPCFHFRGHHTQFVIRMRRCGILR